MPGPDLHVGVVLALSPKADETRLGAFTRRLLEDARGPLESSTGARWRFEVDEPTRLASDEPQRPSDFLDEASLRMVEGPYDVVVVLTDVALVSRRRQVAGGLASPVARVIVLSTRKLLVAPRDAPVRRLEDEAVRWNAATLLVHLVGHVLGLPHARDGPMAPFAFDEARREVAPFPARDLGRLRRRAARAPERELVGGGPLRALAFHLASAARHPRTVLAPVLRSRAPLLSLSLPGLATAALVPTFILIFTAEIWDVGLNLGNVVSWAFAAVAILAATAYLTEVQNLFFPRREKRVVTEHIAVANVAIFLTVLLAVVGLFAMVAALMLFIEFYVFPPGLIATWPTLESPEVTALDKLRLAGFVSTLAVLTGALAGGIEKRTVVRHLALFRDEP